MEVWSKKLIGLFRMVFSKSEYKFLLTKYEPRQ